MLVLPLVLAVVVSLAAVHAPPSTAIGSLETSQRWTYGLETGGGLIVLSCLPISLLLLLQKKRRWAAGTILVCVGVLAALVLSVRARIAAARARPHVLLITLDGFSANHMALYGSTRVPTPFLDALAARSLVGLNFFPQACCTAPGLLSFLSGRTPIETGVFYPPHSLDAAAQYQTLVTSLKAVGYRTIQLTDELYSDANGLGVRGFDRVGGWEGPRPWTPTWMTPHRWLMTSMISSLGFRTEEIPLGEPTAGPGDSQSKLELLLEELERTQGPLFAQVHLLESHGPTFPVRDPLFARGQTQSEHWMPDFYDDELRELDTLLSGFFSKLATRGLSGRVLVVVSSDHGSRWDATERIPLILYGPGVSPLRLLENAQPIDVAPTIMRLLGLRPPSWLSGRSLVDPGRLDPARTLISTSVYGNAPHEVTGRWEIGPTVLNRGLGRVDVIACDRRFSLDMVTGSFSEQRLRGNFAACPPASLLGGGKMLSDLLGFLQEHGYAPLAIPRIADVLDE